MQTSRMSFEYFRKLGIVILFFSGLGGDQGVSNFGRNVPVDLILDKRFKELLIWKDNIFKCLNNFHLII